MKNAVNLLTKSKVFFSKEFLLSEIPVYPVTMRSLRSQIRMVFCLIARSDL